MLSFTSQFLSQFLILNLMENFKRNIERPIYAMFFFSINVQKAMFSKKNKHNFNFL